jgi:magnesium-protoporphyrin IX monomethyl ester (oxidative) cyclase
VFNITTQITRQVFPLALDTDAPKFRQLLEKMRGISAAIDRTRVDGGVLAAVKRAGLSLAAALTFARLYLQPVETNEAPANVRLQPVW